ncbi:MAG: RNA polymerase sigma factor for flagellar operon FliA [Planctomycetota bacterium]
MPTATQTEQNDKGPKPDQVFAQAESEAAVNGARTEKNGERQAPLNEAERRESEALAEQLWTRYREVPSDEHRNLLVEHYQPLADLTVGQFAMRLPRRVDRGDLDMAANLGVIAAIAGFDASRGVQFEFYCRRRIRGALLDELRTQDWLPRPWREMVERHKRVLEQLARRQDEKPRDEEIAQLMGMSLETYNRSFGTGLPDAPAGSGLDSGGETFDGLDVVPDMRFAAPGESLTREELLQIVTQKLTRKESRLIYMRYWEGLSMREIGDELGLSESFVCKIHVRLIDRLRERFQGASAD